MANENNVATIENRTRTFRWLFYMSLAQLLVFFIVPAFIYRAELLVYAEILAAMTLGLIFALFFLVVNVYGLFVDKSRRRLYVSIIVLVTAWVAWSIISWSYIEYMDYLLR